MSIALILSSYADTKIQEFFIENTYPSKAEVLSFYSYLYRDFELGEGSWARILKTQFIMASESGISNDMRVGSIIKILEKYGIVERWVGEIEWETQFRWKWVTLLQEKRPLWALLIDWKRQELLKQESYFKLDEIKRIFFNNICLKRSILEYFWDEEDLKKMPKNCGMCDICKGKKVVSPKWTEREKRAKKETSKKSISDTFEETLQLLTQKKSVEEISLARELNISTIFGHIERLYQSGKFPLSRVLDYVNLQKIKIIKQCIETYFSQETELKLKPIKEKLESLWDQDIDYGEIKVALAMIEKKDI